MKKYKYFIDFDDTLFDRTSFIDDLFGIVKSFGFSDDEVHGSYKMVYGDGYDGIWAQLDYLHKNIRTFDLEFASCKIENFLVNLDKYLYPEAVGFLSSIDLRKYDIQLLTVGGIDFQKTKVRATGIEKFFSRCNYTLDKKSVALKKLVHKDEIFVLLDDKDRELEAVKKDYPNSITLKAEQNLLSFINPITLVGSLKTEEYAK